jgi:hypothetical protein
MNAILNKRFTFWMVIRDVPAIATLLCSCIRLLFILRANVPWYAAWRNHRRVAARAFHQRSDGEVDVDKRCLLWSRLLADSKLDTVSNSLTDLRISRPSNSQRWLVAGVATCTSNLPDSRLRCHRTAYTT